MHDLCKMMFLRLARLEAAREKEGGRRAALTSVLRRRYAERSPIVSTPSAALSTLAMPNASSAHWSSPVSPVITSEGQSSRRASGSAPSGGSAPASRTSARPGGRPQRAGDVRAPEPGASAPARDAHGEVPGVGRREPHRSAAGRGELEGAVDLGQGGARLGDRHQRAGPSLGVAVGGHDDRVDPLSVVA